ncbi:hypothetical protein AWH62_01680 [Maricaulis sp. W15]|uniref:hypothetical protein n=1 Tax=Maricaulis sp. W15 TaxID=1772333 RepID=UPI000948C838|nr:hypothetical protein [Maricaulis sp. W15]OLF81408.1 hypothetical protein AWH62_01680 [Maricaulis sp. W15]
MRVISFLTLPLVLAACSPSSPPAGDALFSTLSDLCGQAFEGRVVSDDPRDADWASEILTLHVRECTPGQLRMPMHVGDNRSRTFVLSRVAGGLEFKHEHRHEDGIEDVLSQYGGTTVATPTESHAEFPADQFTRVLFDREGIAVSMQNVWSITLTDTTFTYALDRPGRHFEAEFDLTEPVDAPPPPWGAG